MPPPPDRVREAVAGPESGPEPPFPIHLNGPIIKGFGRGSKELGIPTANIPLEGLSVGGNSELESGIYYGWAGLQLSSTQQTSKPIVSEEIQKAHATTEALVGDSKAAPTLAAAKAPEVEGSTTTAVSSEKGVVYPMVMSLGYNPFYKNTVRSVEVHIMHTFPHDFYDSHLNLEILGFIRPEYDYVSKDLLIQDIKTDIEVAARSLARPEYAKRKDDEYLRTFPS